MWLGYKTVSQSQNSVYELFVILHDTGKSITKLGYPFNLPNPNQFMGLQTQSP
jgi:hypothetical protein